MNDWYWVAIGLAAAGVAPGYLEGETAETFDLYAYLARFNPKLLSSPEGRRAATELDPLLFALVYLRDHLRAEATRNEITFCDAHLDWCRDALQWIRPATQPRADRDAYIAPRETGKSTWHFLILPLWAAAHGHRKFIAAFSDSATQAEMHLQTFKNELENNELLRQDYRDLCEPATRFRGATQSDTKGLTIRKSGFVFGARGVDASSLGMKVGHQRPDMLILDDVEPGEDKYSEYQIQGRLTTITDVIMPLNEYARVVIVGTVVMPGSIIHQLVRSVTEPDGDVPEWISEQNVRVHYYPPIIHNDDGTERSIWPAKWSMAFLNAIRHTRSYLKNFANSPLGADGDYWSIEDFRYGTLTGKTRVMLSIDPAVTEKKTSDWTGLAVIGWSPPPKKDPRRQSIDAEDIRLQVLGNLGMCEIMYAKAVRMTGNKLRAEVLRILEMFDTIALVLVETDQGGDLWLDILHHLPVKLQTIKQHINKKARAAELLSHYQRGRVVHTTRLPQAEEQMVAFPKAPHDDLVDAVGSGVCRLLRRPVKSGASVRATGGYA